MLFSGKPSMRLMRFYVGKGAVPYGDHHPWTQTHEDNGKCGMAAVLFNLLGQANGAEFFARMSVASHGAERDTGHTGNFCNILWSLPGVAQAGPHATGTWMNSYLNLLPTIQAPLSARTTRNSREDLGNPGYP